MVGLSSAGSWSLRKSTGVDRHVSEMNQLNEELDAVLTDFEIAVMERDFEIAELRGELDRRRLQEP